MRIARRATVGAALTPSPAASRACAAAQAVALALALALCVVACGSAGPSPSAVTITPVPGGVAGTVPLPQGSFRPPTSSTFDDAIRALDALTSYRVSVTQSGGGLAVAGGAAEVQERFVIVNAKPHRVRTEMVANGQVMMATIQIGSKEWRSFAGSTWEADDMGGGIGLPADQEDDWWSNPVGDQVWFTQNVGSATLADLGVEQHGTVVSRHVRATVGPPSGFAEGDEFGDMQSFVGVADAWIAVDGGWLVGMSANGNQLNREIDDNGDPTGDPTAQPIHVELAVSGVNDEANRVDPPEAVDPTPLPSGDPEVVALLQAAAGAMSALDSYRARIDADTGGSGTAMALTVVNRPVRAAHLVLEAPGVQVPAGTALEYLAVGDLAWERDGSGAWRSSTTADALLCSGAAGGAGADGCLGPIDATLAQFTSLAVTYARVGEEVVGGVPVTHLHSDAGLGGGADGSGMTLPGPVDIWLARDGGYLVRLRFQGSLLAYDITVDHVNDAANVVEPPASFLPAAGGDPLGSGDPAPSTAPGSTEPTTAPAAP